MSGKLESYPPTTQPTFLTRIYLLLLLVSPALPNHRFKQVIDEVETQGELNNTIVCVTSDHGELVSTAAHIFYSTSLMYAPSL